MPEMIQIKYAAGLGDAVHQAILLSLYVARGYEVTVACPSPQKFVFRVAGCQIAEGEPDYPLCRWENFREWGDFKLPVYATNKALNGFGSSFLPFIGTKKQLWPELRNKSSMIAARKHIPKDVWDSVSDFLKNRQRPIVCTHSTGDSFSGQKNLDPVMYAEVMRRLTEEHGVTLVPINHSKAEPQISNGRIISPESWRKLGIDWLCALYYQSDLMIGIDSGPFHLAAFTDVPCLGVFRQLQPIHCCLPNPRAEYLVSSKYHETWERDQPEWSFTEYQGEEPTADDIVNAALERIKQGRLHRK